MTKVLIIEDEVPIREEVMDWLLFEGYEVVGVANGHLGLEAIHHAIPDLILCDIAMPELSGYEVLIEVRSSASLNHIPFVFLTAVTDRALVRKGMDMGADDYLTKPFTHAEVLNLVRSRLQKKVQQDRQVQQRLDILNLAFNEEREKRLLKSRLVAMFSHDFRNPLSLILSSSDILKYYEDLLSPERKQLHYDRIQGSVHLLQRMLDDMLTLAEMEGGYREYVPQSMTLPPLVETIVEEFHLIDQGAHTLTFHNALPDEVEADPKLLRQILTNLISNALKYSPSGTDVTITLFKDADEIHLVVEDRGIGIPEESQSCILDPFYRAANAKGTTGTGLGLTIVKECTDRHGGKIEVESQIGVGSRFTVKLPFYAAHQG